MIVQIQTRKFLAGINAQTPDDLRDILVAVANLQPGVAWEIAADIRARYKNSVLAITTEFVTVTLPDYVDF